MPTYRNDGDAAVPVEDVNGRRFYLQPGATVESYKIYGAEVLTKMEETPYFPIVKVFEAEFESPGTKTGLADCEVIRLTPTGDIVVTANHADNPYSLMLIDGVAMDIESRKCVASLIFTGAGSVKIEGF